MLSRIILIILSYTRFTETGMMDSPNDFLVGEQYWDFIGGKNTFTQLLETFDGIGKEYKEKLQEKFKKIASEKIKFILGNDAILSRIGL